MTGLRTGFRNGKNLRLEAQSQARSQDQAAKSGAGNLEAGAVFSVLLGSGARNVETGSVSSVRLGKALSGPGLGPVVSTSVYSVLIEGDCRKTFYGKLIINKCGLHFIF